MKEFELLRQLVQEFNKVAPHGPFSAQLLFETQKAAEQVRKHLLLEVLRQVHVATVIEVGLGLRQRQRNCAFERLAGGFAGCYNGRLQVYILSA